MRLTTVLALTIYFSGSQACQCEDEAVMDTVCKSQFAAKVTVTDHILNVDGSESYDIQLVRPEKFATTKDAVQRVFSSIGLMDVCKGPTLNIGETYLVTGNFYGVGNSAIYTSSCQRAIKWSDFELMSEYPNYRPNCAGSKKGGRKSRSALKHLLSRK